VAEEDEGIKMVRKREMMNRGKTIDMDLALWSLGKYIPRHSELHTWSGLI